MIYADVFVHKPECTSAPKRVLNGCIAAGYTPRGPCRERLYPTANPPPPPGETDERRTDRERGKNQGQKKRDLTTRTHREKMKGTD